MSSARSNRSVSILLPSTVSGESSSLSARGPGTERAGGGGENGGMMSSPSRSSNNNNDNSIRSPQLQQQPISSPSSSSPRQEASPSSSLLSSPGVRMFPLSTSLPRLERGTECVSETPHYTTFHPRRQRSAWRTAESMSNQRVLEQHTFFASISHLGKPEDHRDSSTNSNNNYNNGSGGGDDYGGSSVRNSHRRLHDFSVERSMLSASGPMSPRASGGIDAVAAAVGSDIGAASDGASKQQQQRKRVSVLLMETIDWDARAIEREIYRPDQREYINREAHDALLEMAEAALRPLPPMHGNDEMHSSSVLRGDSSLTQQTFRRLLPSMKRKQFGVGGVGGGGRRGGGDGFAPVGSDVMTKYAPEWLVNGKTLGPYARENLDTLFVRSVLALPECPHIKHILILNVEMTRGRVAVLLHRGFGPSSSLLWSSSPSSSPHGSGSIGGGDGSSSPAASVSLVQTSSSVPDSSGVLPPALVPQQHNASPSASSLRPPPPSINNNNNSTPTTNLTSLCLAFCELGPAAAQILFEWATFAPSAAALTSLDVSHNLLENDMVPQILRMLQRNTLRHINLRGNSGLFATTTTANQQQQQQHPHHHHVVSSANPHQQYAPVTAAVFLNNVKDNLVTVELSLCGITAEQMLPVVNGIMHYSFASLSLDGADMSVKSAASILEHLTQSTSLVYLGLKFIVSCAGKLYQERLTHLLMRNLELFYEAQVYQVLKAKYHGDDDQIPKKSVIKAAQAAFMQLQPHFATGTPTELLEMIKKSSLQRALQGELVPTAFVMRKTTTGLKVKGIMRTKLSSFGGSESGGNRRRSGAPLSGDFAPSSSYLSQRSLLPSEQIARQLERDADNASDCSSDVPSEVERDVYISSALPPGYAAYTTNDPTKQLQALQQTVKSQAKVHDMERMEDVFASSEALPRSAGGGAKARSGGGGVNKTGLELLPRRLSRGDSVISTSTSATTTTTTTV